MSCKQLHNSRLYMLILVESWIEAFATLLRRTSRSNKMKQALPLWLLLVSTSRGGTKEVIHLSAMSEMPIQMIDDMWPAHACSAVKQ